MHVTSWPSKLLVYKIRWDLYVYEGCREKRMREWEWERDVNGEESNAFSRFDTCSQGLFSWQWIMDFESGVDFCRIHRFVNGHHCTALVRVSVDRQTPSKSVQDLKPVKMDTNRPSALSVVALLLIRDWFDGLRVRSSLLMLPRLSRDGPFVNKSASIFAKISPLIGCTKFPHLPKRSLPI